MFRSNFVLLFSFMGWYLLLVLIFVFASSFDSPFSLLPPLILPFHSPLFRFRLRFPSLISFASPPWFRSLPLLDFVRFPSLISFVSPPFIFDFVPFIFVLFYARLLLDSQILSISRSRYIFFFHLLLFASFCF